MIKPFKVIDVRTEADGAIGVIYEVWKVTSIGPGLTDTRALTAYMQIPEGTDIDEYLFQELSKAGWF